MAQPQINERITARVSSANRELIERAALLTGATNLNSFFTSVVIKEAKRIVHQHEVLQLSRADAQAFVTALDEPASVNENLLKAARQYKKAIQDKDG